MNEEKDPFAFITLTIPKRAPVFPGSVGAFRYRLARDGKAGEGTIQASVYENICFEKARHVETETFPWTEEGMVRRASRAQPETGGLVIPGLGAPRRGGERGGRFQPMGCLRRADEARGGDLDRIFAGPAPVYLL